MEPRIVVIGASAGGFAALQQLVAALPPALPASLFIVWHMSPDVRGVLPQVLNRANTLPAAHAVDHEAIVPGRIYVAPPDRHLLVERGRVRVTKGPKENRFRPAVDPLFRSAAYVYGSSVIGVVLSGALDDGTSGLWTVKEHGGTAIVQDPHDAEVPSMPEHALREVAVDYVLPVADMALVLARLCHEPIASTVEAAVPNTQQIEIEVRIAAEDNALELGIMQLGTPTPYTCPECHGVLSAFKDGSRVRFRCHTGHAFSADSLLIGISEAIEESLWSAIRTLDEGVLLLNHMGDHFAEANHTKLAALYFQKANEAGKRTQRVREIVMQHEQLSDDRLRQEAEATNGEGTYYDNHP